MTTNFSRNTDSNNGKKVDWKSKERLSDRWKAEGIRYASSVNSFVKKGETEGWEKAGKEPEDQRGDMALEVLEIIREANKTLEIETLREYFPPAHQPFMELYEKVSKSIESIFLLEDGNIVFREGSPWQEGKVHIVNESGYHGVMPGVIRIGRSPDRKLYAIAYKDHIDVHKGWQVKVIGTFEWPTGLEGFPEGEEAEVFDPVHDVNEIIPFPNGERVLLVSSKGIFVLQENNNIRIHPNEESLLEWWSEADKNGEFSVHLDMAYGSISPDGKFTAVGDQCSDHIILDASFNKYASIYPESSYPHYSIFSKDGEYVAFNSCHFYNGSTIGFKLSSLLEKEEEEIYQETISIDDVCRVYAGVAREDEYILGDAYGYIHSFSVTGEKRWRYFLGSTISGIDVSSDGKTLVVGTYAGILHLLDLDTGKEDPYRIGNATHLEKRRWLVWNGESDVLVW